MPWISTKDRLPTKAGYYKIKNNAFSCNNGIGKCEWTGKEWDVPEIIKSFTKILYWWE